MRARDGTQQLSPCIALCLFTASLYACDKPAQPEQELSPDEELESTELPPELVDENDAELFEQTEDLDETVDLPPDEDLDSVELDPTDSDHDGIPDALELELGTNPLDPDSDDDGFDDGTELELGTKANDPSSAPAWQPAYSARPRLYISPEELPAIRAKLENPEAELLLQRLQALAERSVPPHPERFDERVSAQQAQIAEAAAVLAYLGEELEWAQKALDIMEAPTPDPHELNKGVVPDGSYNLYESEALVSFCSAYDLLAAMPQLDTSAARQRLLEKIADYREIMLEPGAYHNLMFTALNNHVLKVQGALGLCAMALSDHPDAAADFNEAVSGFDYLFFHFQGIEGGGYAEGWNYLQYGAVSFLPFVWALHKWRPEQCWPGRATAKLILGDPRAGELGDYCDPAANPLFEAIFVNMLRSAQPNGLSAPWDDANPVAFPGEVLAALLDEGAFAWNWRKPAVGLATPHAEWLSLIALGRVTPREPPWPLDEVLVEPGFALIRSDWSDAATSLVFLAEHRAATRNGLGHEHADPLSIVLYAHGEALLIDPGYINWEHHALVLDGSDHNILLVNGEGPPFQWTVPMSDAYIDGSSMEQEWIMFSGYSEYREAQLQRRLVAFDKRAFVVADRARAELPKSFSGLWNGNAGVESGSAFSLQEHGAIWTRGGASLQVVSVSTNGAGSWSHHREEHATSWGVWAEHICAQLSAEPTQELAFLSLLLPLPASQVQPTVAAEHPAERIAMLSWSDGEAEHRVFLSEQETSTVVQIEAESITVLPGLSWSVTDSSGQGMQQHWNW
ncbi:MAG: heparinase II/III family protein [Myxococcota bacterium]|nr:heparinase II/III family protein [Myxococcota bacterium]